MCGFRFLSSQLRYNEGPLGWRNIFATSRLSLLVLFHVIGYYWGEEFRVCYTEDIVMIGSSYRGSI